MIRCPNCGTENARTNRYCAECGTRLERPAEPAAPAAASPQGDRAPTDTSAAPLRPIDPSPIAPLAPLPTDPVDLPPTDPNWRMSPAEPYVPTQRRRTWLWIIGGILGVCVLLCVGLVVWGSTIGRPTLDGLATQFAIEATRQASGTAIPASTP